MAVKYFYFFFINQNHTKTIRAITLDYSNPYFTIWLLIQGFLNRYQLPVISSSILKPAIYVPIADPNEESRNISKIRVT